MITLAAKKKLCSLRKEKNLRVLDDDLPVGTQELAGKLGVQRPPRKLSFQVAFEDPMPVNRKHIIAMMIP